MKKQKPTPFDSDEKPRFKPGAKRSMGGVLYTYCRAGADIKTGPKIEGKGK